MENPGDYYREKTELAHKLRKGIKILEAEMPEPSHEGSCILGITDCDGICMDRATVSKMIWELKKRLEQAEYVGD